jgi:hypothetical protein
VASTLKGTLARIASGRIVPRIIAFKSRPLESTPAVHAMPSFGSMAIYNFPFGGMF